MPSDYPIDLHVKITSELSDLIYFLVAREKMSKAAVVRMLFDSAPEIQGVRDWRRDNTDEYRRLAGEGRAICRER